MTWEERLRAIQGDLKWLLIECVTAEELECAQASIVVTLSVSDLINKLHDHGLDDADWNRESAVGKTVSQEGK